MNRLLLVVSPRREALDKDTVRRLERALTLLSGWATPGEPLSLTHYGWWAEVRGGSAPVNFDWQPDCLQVQVWRDFERHAPVFCHRSSELWVCSVSLKAAAAVLGRVTLNRQAAAESLSLGLIAHRRDTIYQELYRSELNTHETWTASGVSAQAAGSGPWLEAPRFLSRTAALNEWQSRLGQACARVTERAGGKVAVALSGGLDSVMLAAEFATLCPQVTLLTSLHSAGGADPEEAPARAAGRWLGQSHEIVVQPFGQAFEAAEGLLSAAAEPLCNPYIARSFRFYQTIAAQGFSTVVLGEDGDSLLSRDALSDLGWRAGSPALLLGLVWSLAQGMRPSLGWRRWRASGPGAAAGRSALASALPMPRALEEGSPVAAPWRPRSACNLSRLDVFGQFFDALTPDWTQLPLRFELPLFEAGVMDFLLRLPSWPWALDKHLFRQYLEERGAPREVTGRPKSPLSVDPMAQAQLVGGQELAALVDELGELSGVLDLELARRLILNWDNLEQKDEASLAISFLLWYKGTRIYLENVAV